MHDFGLGLGGHGHEHDVCHRHNFSPSCCDPIQPAPRTGMPPNKHSEQTARGRIDVMLADPGRIVQDKKRINFNAQ